MSYVIEEESGTYTGPRHRYNGYHAGDFRDTPMATRQQLDSIMRMRPPTFPGPRS